ncbi:hypothetical protein NPIL_561751 [Nephila pilipes]|uniref:Uncharacterized protein n=1 Tax=Nephila pilipes TaxID=299642 RepID=A0A8X6UL44_NEPPI|nr:hypothetical protein NPIL_561751 [Nephila pilipes]
MADENKIFNMKNPNDHETIRNVLLCDSDDENGIVHKHEEELILESEVIGQAKDLTHILDIWKYLITDRVTERIVEEIKKCICSLKHNYSRLRDVRDMDGTEMEAFLSLLWLVFILEVELTLMNSGEWTECNEMAMKLNLLPFYQN